MYQIKKTEMVIPKWRVMPILYRAEVIDVRDDSVCYVVRGGSQAECDTRKQDLFLMMESAGCSVSFAEPRDKLKLPGAR